MAGTKPETDRTFVALSQFLETMEIETDTDEPTRLVMVCQTCGESLFGIEDGDTLRVLFNSCLAHDCI